MPKRSQLKKSKSRKMAAGRKRSSAAKKKIAVSRPKAKKAANRRAFRRYATKTLWVTELSGDYRFIVAAGDLSEGGIFLTRRMKTSREESQLTLHLGAAGSLEVNAQPVYDRLGKGSYGTGYRFVDLSAAQAKALRGYLRNLD